MGLFVQAFYVFISNARFLIKKWGNNKKKRLIEQCTMQKTYYYDLRLIKTYTWASITCFVLMNYWTQFALS